MNSEEEKIHIISPTNVRQKINKCKINFLVILLQGSANHDLGTLISKTIYFLKKNSRKI